MKKSVLFSTIAMIVVVIIALSTATFAWFSSDAKSYASQQITTATTSDLIVLANSSMILDLENDTASFDTNALLTNTQHPASSDVAGIRAGLWAPTSELALTCTQDSVGAVPSGVVGYMQGTQNAAGTTFKCTTAETNTSPDMIRITSMKSGSNNVNLIIYIGASNTDNSRFAAQGVSFYIADGTAAIANSIYHKANSTAAALAVNATTPTSNFVQVAASGTIADSASANHRATTTTVGTGFSDNAADGPADKAGIAAATYNKYYTMTISLGSFTQNQSKNIVLYNWLDGAYLNDAAGSADIAIAYAFAFAA
jgi:hypothetical protein